MANASKDDNRVSTLIAALDTDGTTPTRVKVDASTKALNIADGTTGTDNGVNRAVKDGNRIPVWLGVSSADGTTPVEIYSDSNGNLLINSL